MEWYIDSWNVRDGLAFASKREPDSLDAVYIVFVAPPHFEPIPINSMSTALAAARGTFQAGFNVGPEGEEREVAFESLDQLVEAVRRAYLAAGSGLIPPPEGEGEPYSLPLDFPPEDGEPPQDYWSSWEELRDSLEHLKDKSDIAHSIEHLWEPGMEKACCQLAGELMGPASIHPILAGFSGTTRNQRNWLFILSLLISRDYLRYYLRDILDRLADIWHPLFRDWLNWLEIFFEHEYPYFYPWFPIELNAKDLMRGLLFRIPLSHRWRVTPDAQTMGDNLYASLATRDNVSKIEKLDHFLPLYFGALLIVLCSRGESFQLGRSDFKSQRQQIRKRAAQWLADALPGLELEGHEAEEAINNMVVYGRKQGHYS